MKTTEFNENFEIDRRARGVKALPKHAPNNEPEIMTADGAAYDPNTTYHFFEQQTAEVRQSLGLRRDEDYLCTFGLKVVAIAKLRANRNSALADGQSFYKSEIERLQKRIQDFESKKQTHTDI